MLGAWIDTWLAPGFAAWTLDADLARVRCALLALDGDRDEDGSRRHPERIGARVAGPSEIVILEDCGHVPQREQPETAGFTHEIASVAQPAWQRRVPVRKRGPL